MNLGNLNPESYSQILRCRHSKHILPSLETPSKQTFQDVYKETCFNYQFKTSPQFQLHFTSHSTVSRLLPLFCLSDIFLYPSLVFLYLNTCLQVFTLNMQPWLFLPQCLKYSSHSFLIQDSVLKDCANARMFALTTGIQHHTRGPSLLNKARK